MAKKKEEPTILDALKSGALRRGGKAPAEASIPRRTKGSGGHKARPYDVTGAEAKPAKASIAEAPEKPLRSLWRRAALFASIIATFVVLFWIPRLEPTDSYLGVTLGWIIASILFFVSVWPPRETPRVGWRDWWETHKWTAIALTGLTLVAWLLRVWDVAAVPFTFSGDEASQSLQVLRVLKGELRNPFSTSWLAVPTMSFFYSAPFTAALGPTVFAMRLPWTIAGALTIPLTYFLVARLAGTRVAWATAILLAVYHFHIHYSRLASVQVTDAFFMALALWLLYRAMDKGSLPDWAAAGAATAGSLYFYTGGRLVAIIVAGILLYHILYKGLGFISENWRGMLVALGAFLIVGAPMLQYAVMKPNEYNARINQVGIIQSGWLEREVDILNKPASAILFDQFRRATLAFNFYPDRTIWYGLRDPLLDPLFGILFLLGLGYATLRAALGGEGTRLFPMAAWWWAGTLIGGMMTESPPSTMRLVGLTVPACFFIVLVLDRLAHLLKNAFARIPAQAVMAAGVAAFAVVSLKTYFVDYTPLRIYGSSRGELATVLGPMIAERTPEYKVYFVGAPFMYWGFATLPFFAPDAEAVDIEQTLTGPPSADLIPEGRGVIFVILPERIAELEFIQQAFPGGEIEVIQTDSFWRTTATLYTVNP